MRLIVNISRAAILNYEAFNDIGATFKFAAAWHIAFTPLNIVQKLFMNSVQVEAGG
jgi:hypothetical protein